MAILNGTEGNDTIIGTTDADTINGLGGNDFLAGDSGDDSIVGGTGNDTYSFDADGPQGSDTITDTIGYDTLDFSATTTKSVVLSLASSAAQVSAALLPTGVTAPSPVTTTRLPGTSTSFRPRASSIVRR